MKFKKVIFDMFLNIIATSLPTIVLQLIIFPAMSNCMDSDSYGLVVTILAVLNVVPSSIGVVLNNIRLLHEEKYVRQHQQGDFQILLFICQALNIVVMTLLSWYYMGANKLLHIVMLIVASVLWLGREYHIVAFRLKLNYVAILLNNLSLVAGYGIGYILFRKTGYWEFIYILGYLCSYIYIAKNSEIIREPIQKTPLFSTVSKDAVLLILANILSRAINYADKILLYPLLGGTMVTIYYVATVFGKVVSLAITPINSVALSYLSKIENKPDKLFKRTCLLGAGLCLCGYIFAVLLSHPILSILYPRYVAEAMKYIYITSATIAVSVLGSMVTPFVLRFFDMKWQIFINGITTVGYILISLMLLHLWGMMGFCIGALISNIIKLVSTICIYFRKNKCSVADK